MVIGQGTVNLIAITVVIGLIIAIVILGALMLFLVESGAAWWLASQLREGLALIIFSIILFVANFGLPRKSKPDSHSP